MTLDPDSPKHAAGCFQLACLFMQRQAYQEAALHFAKIQEKHFFYAEAQTNLATCYLKLGHWDEAKKHYLCALAFDASDTQAIFNLGVICTHQGRVNEARDYYLHALRINPNYFEAHINLGAYYWKVKNRDQALRHYREALRLRPDDEMARHHVRVLVQDSTLSSTPSVYIQSLFDEYAAHYDAHMRDSLHYQVPEALYALMARVQVMPRSAWDVLDLGCGTGLCGERFRPHARRLAGVDLSEKMLHEAAKRNIYDELIQLDVVSYLAGQIGQFDLILAGDVLVYFGELDTLMQAAAAALKSGGLFAFTVESGEKEDYRLMPSGRFAHRSEYLRKLAALRGFIILERQRVALRWQENEAVTGEVYLYQRKECIA